MKSILNNRSFDTFRSVYVKNNNNAYFPWISKTTTTSVKFSFFIPEKGVHFEENNYNSTHAYACAPNRLLGFYLSPCISDHPSAMYESKSFVFQSAP